MLHMIEYTPMEDDVRWAKDILAAIPERGIWVVPIIGLRFRVSHTLRHLVLLNGSLLNMDGNREAYECLMILFKTLNYTVTILQ